MKKILALLLAASFAVSAVFAADAKIEPKATSKKVVKEVVKPEVSKEGIKFGLKAGLALTTLAINSADDEVDISMKFGRMEGLFLVVPMGKVLALQPELVWVQKGGKFDIGVDDMNMYFKANVVYLQPLLKFRLGAPGASVRPHFLFGPQVGLLSALRQQMEVAEEGMYMNMPDEIKKDIDFGLVGGFGLDLKKVTLDIRYDLGLTNLINVEGDEGSIKSRGFVATVGYLFN